MKKEIMSWVKCILLAVVLAVFVSEFIIVNSRIPSGSMENTIMTGDRLIAMRTAYWFSDPKRGDIVVFKYPDDPDELFIKRIIGEPGDKVEIVDGELYINDEHYEESYLKEDMEGSFGPYEVPEDCYFMMGDNRNDSLDSRFWNDKFVKKSAILGKAWLQYYPSVGLIKDQTPEDTGEARETDLYEEEVTEFSSDTTKLSFSDLESGINFKAEDSDISISIPKIKAFDNSLDFEFSVTDAEFEEDPVTRSISKENSTYKISGLEAGKEYYIEVYPTKAADSDADYEAVEEANADITVSIKQ